MENLSKVNQSNLNCGFRSIRSQDLFDHIEGNGCASFDSLLGQRILLLGRNLLVFTLLHTVLVQGLIDLISVVELVFIERVEE